MRVSGFALALLLAGTSLSQAADLIIEAPETLPSPEIDVRRFGWTGAGVGLTGGYAWLRDIDRAINFRDKGEDWVYGAYANYNMQFGSFVGGFEVDYLKADIAFEVFPVVVEDLASIRSRFGYVFDRALLYVDGGVAYGTTNINLEGWGIVGGIGVDYAATDKLVIGAKYSHYDFNEFDNTLIDANLDIVTVRAGYKF